MSIFSARTWSLLLLLVEVVLLFVSGNSHSMNSLKQNEDGETSSPHITPLTTTSYNSLVPLTPHTPHTSPPHTSHTDNNHNNNNGIRNLIESETSTSTTISNTDSTSSGNNTSIEVVVTTANASVQLQWQQEATAATRLRQKHLHEHWLVDVLDTMPREQLFTVEDRERDRETEKNKKNEKNADTNADAGSVIHNDRQADRDEQYRRDMSFVKESVFHPEDLSVLQEMMTRFGEDPKTMKSMWSVVPEISIHAPFIFFHQRKAGGSALRQSLLDAAATVRLPSYIVCYNGVDCDIYDIGNKKAFAVYAGHFKWGVQSDLARWGNMGERRHIRTHFSCATNFRQPIDRIESCIYFRFGQQTNHTCIMDMPVHTFEKVLHWVDDFGNSCLNEPFRSLSGFHEESAIDQLMESDFKRRRRSLRRTLLEQRQLNSPSYNRLSPLSLAIFNSTLSHAQQCSSLVLEIPESYSAVSHRFPMLGDVGGFVSDRKSNVNHYHTDCPKTSGERRDIIRKAAALEVLLYESIFNKTRDHVESENAYVFLHECVYRATPKIDPVSQVAAPSNTTQPHVLSVIIVAFNESVRREFSSMVQTITSHPLPTVYESVDPRSVGNVPRSRFSRIRLSISATCTVNDSIAIADAGYFNLVPTGISNSSSNMFDKQFYPLTGLTDCADNVDKVPRFEKMAILVKDPFLTIYLEVFAASTNSSADKSLLTWFDNHLALKARMEKIVRQGLNTPSGRKLTRSSYLQSRLNTFGSSLSPQLAGARHHQQLELGKPDSTIKAAIGKNVNEVESLHQIPIVNDHPPAPHPHPPQLPSATALKHPSTTSHSSSVVRNHKAAEDMARYMKTFNSATAFLEFSGDDETLFYEYFYSLFVSPRQYVSLFRSHFQQQVRRDKTMEEEADISYNGRVRLGPHHYQFYSYDGIVDESFDQQLKMLLKGYDREETIIKGSTTAPTVDLTTTKKALKELRKEAMNTNIFVDMLEFAGIIEKNDIVPPRLQCAFGSAKSIDKGLVLKDIPAMKVFYAEHPAILKAVQSTIKERLQSIGLQPHQMHFMFKLE